MKKFILISIIFFTIFITSLTQGQINQVDRPLDAFRSFLDFYSDNRLSTSAAGKGYTGIATGNGLSGVILNPATLNLKKNVQFHFEYNFKNKVPLEGGTSDDFISQLHPTMFLGIGASPTNFIETGIFYTTNNNYRIDGKLIMSSYPDSSDTSNFYEKMRVNSLVIPCIFKFNRFFQVGTNLIYSKYSLKTVTEDFFGQDLIGEASFEQFLMKFGVLILPHENFSIGLTFLPQTKETITVNYNTGIAYRFKPNVFPAKFGVGLWYKLFSFPIAFSLDYNYSNDSKDESLVDRHDVHFGVEYEMKNSLTLRGGLFTLFDYRIKNYPAFQGITEHDQFLTTLGFSSKLRFFTVDFSVMDSHLLSSGSIKQTYVNSGLTYNFR